MRDPTRGAIDPNSRLYARFTYLARVGSSRNGLDGSRLPALLERLASKYDLAAKAARTPGLEEILIELLGRIIAAFGSFAEAAGKRILDVACGSKTSRAPDGKRGYSALFEPWLCRMLHEGGAEAVGLDLGDLGGEGFEWHSLDLGLPGAMDFLPSAYFDAVHDSRLFGSPEFTARFRDRASVLRIAAEIRGQEDRALRPGGIIMHSDAHELLG